MLVAMDKAFSFGLIGGYVGAGQVLDELFPPIYGRRRYCKYQLRDGRDILNFLLFLDRWCKEVLNENPRQNHGERRAYLR